MTKPPFTLPRDLGDGLLLRWGRPEDAEMVAQFNIQHLSDNPNEPEEVLGHATHDLMRGDHPTTRASDFTLVIDQNNDNKLVSTLCIIPQVWTYDGLPFKVGRPELVATDPAYRRRGLVATQFEAIHAKSAANGEMVQAITGIPWFYRQFGYEMGLDLGGGRDFFWSRSGNDEAVAEESYRWRPATPADIPVLHKLYAVHCQESLIATVRDDAQWHYVAFTAHKKGFMYLNAHIVETKEGTAVGYAAYSPHGKQFFIRELAVLPGHSLRQVALFITRMLQAEADELNPKRKKPITSIRFGLGAAHPVYRALAGELEKQRPPYAWFIRVPDLPAFLRHIAPVLENRLANSVLAGFEGKLRLSFYQSHLAVTFTQGKLSGVGPYTPKDFFDCDAFFADLTFLQLLFGQHTVEEINQVRADCYAEKSETAVLLNTLFPKQHSWVSGLE